MQVLLGERIRDARERIPMTRSALASRAKVSSTQLYQIEHGRTLPHMSTLLKVAGVLGVPVSKLVEEPSHKRPQGPRVGTKTLSRIVDRLRDKDEAYLLDVDRLLRVFDQALARRAR